MFGPYRLVGAIFLGQKISTLAKELGENSLGKVLEENMEEAPEGFAEAIKEVQRRLKRSDNADRD